jgi:cation/acetate symporter
MALLLVCTFLLFTLAITYWSAARSKDARNYFAAGRRISGWQNGLAVGGDYMSAASFLGISGMIAFHGYDGFMYSVGWLVAYLTVLLIVAEPLRNVGRYTMADVLAYRLNPRPVRALAAISTLAVSTFYMIAQMVGAGSLVKLLLPGVSYEAGVIAVGALMIVYVVFGGMLATTWVQITKAILLMAGSLVLSLLVLAHFDFSLQRFFAAIAEVSWVAADGTRITRDFLEPGHLFTPPYGALDLVSLGIALILGTAGLPHILVRFYTVPDAPTARVSVMWAMVVIGAFYIMTTFLGFGAATVLTPGRISAENMSAPLLAQALGGEFLFAFISAVAFATILAVVAGLTISASTSFAHDFYTNVLHRGRSRAGAEVRVARTTAFVVGAVAILVAIKLRSVNVAFLVGLAFAVAASANFPVIVLSLFWRRFSTYGACCGLAVGLASSIVLIVLSPSVMGTGPGSLIDHEPIFPLKNPGVLSVPLGLLGAVLATLFTPAPVHADERFAEMTVRANTGIGAERSTDAP